MTPAWMKRMIRRSSKKTVMRSMTSNAPAARRKKMWLSRKRTPMTIGIDFERDTLNA